MRNRLHAKFFLLLLSCLAAPIAGAIAQNNPGGTGVAIATGKCLNLMIGGQSFPGCSTRLASVTLGDGTVQFIFTDTGRMISFSGDGRRITGAKGQAVLPLDFISIGKDQTSPEVTRVSGQCRFGDANAGQPVRIDCKATSSFGSVSASFLTDGKRPQTR